MSIINFTVLAVHGAWCRLSLQFTVASAPARAGSDEPGQRTAKKAEGDPVWPL